MSNNLPSVQTTNQIFAHFETTHRQVMDMIQTIYDLCDDSSEEGQGLMLELEAVREQAALGYEDVKVLKFRNSVMEATIHDINQKQAEQLRRIEHLEDMIVSPHEAERRKERRRGQRNTEDFNRVMNAARQTARR